MISFFEKIRIQLSQFFEFFELGIDSMKTRPDFRNKYHDFVKRFCSFFAHLGSELIIYLFSF